MALGKTVRELEDGMGWDELREWLAVHTHFFPLPNPWLQTGVIAASNANFSGNVKRSHYPIDPRAFVPVVKQKTPWQVQKAKLEIHAAKCAARAARAEVSHHG